MRTLTLARMGRALMIAAAMIMLPQLASAQLPVETRELKLQGATEGAVTIKSEGTAGAGTYTLTMPKTLTAGAGALLYTNNTTGGLSWTNAPTAQQTTLYWNGTSIEWVDPNSSNNPNWSLTGNALTAAGSLGTTTDQAVNFITGASGPNVRMSIAANGNISIATDATNGGDVTIGNDNAVAVNGATIAMAGATSTTINAAAGITNINTGANTSAVNIGNATTATMDLKALATTIVGTSVGINAATTQTGDFNLVGELQMNAQPGTTGDVLVSKGDGNTPAWESITEAVGIRKAGVVALAGVSKTAAAISVPGLLDSDAIIITLQTSSGSAVVATVTDRDDTADTFHVTLSGTYTGAVNYMVIAAQ